MRAPRIRIEVVEGGPATVSALVCVGSPRCDREPETVRVAQAANCSRCERVLAAAGGTNVEPFRKRRV